MALSWDLTKIDNRKELCFIPDKEEEGKGRLHAVTEVLIWATILVGFHQITEKNYKEFHRRLIEWEVVAGGMLSVGMKDGTRTDRMPTIEEVQAHIGLSTNASSKTSRQWLANLGRHVKEEADRRIRNEEWNRRIRTVT